MDYHQRYTAMYRTTALEGECTISVDKRKYRDMNKYELNLHQAVYTVGPVERNCMVKESSQIDPVTFSSYCILKNFRHMNAVSVENFYVDEHGEGRIVVSWVDQSLRGWLVKASEGRRRYKPFEFTHMHSKPSTVFRKMITGMCAAVESMFRNGVYPKSICLDLYYLVNNTNAPPTLKILVSEVVDFYQKDDGIIFNHEQWIWKDVRCIVDECCKIAAKRAMHPDTKRFFRYVGPGTSEKLESYPDTWDDEKKKSFLFFIMAGSMSHVRKRVNGIKNFVWPEDCLGNLPLVIRDLKVHQERKTKSKYNVKDPYDYLRLCRNVIKHWLSLPRYLKVNCNAVSDFLRKMERWSPRIWCDLYEALQA